MKKKQVLKCILFILLLLVILFILSACFEGCCGKDKDKDNKGKEEDKPKNPPPPEQPQSTCTGKENIPCPEQSGVCKGAMRKCTCSGDTCTYTTCDQAAYGPDYQTEETKCDGKDNDCDGVVDELC